ncbi:hypothetical protein HZS_6636 [Henneguya salminicola]|nr:hypothetical protein HZS_6636 [Henneguya salminicola]
MSKITHDSRDNILSLDLHVTNLIEELVLSFLSMLKYYATKTRLTPKDPKLYINIFHYLLFSYKGNNYCMTSKVLEFLNNNIGFKISQKSTLGNSAWMPFFDLLMSPIIWSQFNYDIQAVRMQIICGYMANNMTDTTLTPLPINNILYYMQDINESILKLCHKSEILEPIFKIYTHILQNSKDVVSFEIFYEYFMINNNETLDILAIKCFEQIILKGKIREKELPLASRLIKKFMQLKSDCGVKRTIDFIIELLKNSSPSITVAENTIIGWFCSLLMNLSLSEEILFYLVDNIFLLISNSKTDSGFTNKWLTKIILWSLLLCQKMSLSHRQLLVSRFLKIIEENSSLILHMISIDYLEILLNVPFWNGIHTSLFNILRQYVKDNDVSSSQSQDLQIIPYPSLAFGKIDDIFKATTIVQQISAIHLKIYIKHSRPFEFLISPIFYSEVLGANSLFLSFWHIKLTIINIYLRHFYSLNNDKLRKNKEAIELEICIRLIEIAAFIILELASHNLENITDQQIDLLEDCINLLSLAICKHLTFSQQHLHIPLLIVLRFINFGGPKIIASFCSFVEKMLNLCNPTLFHICATISILYKKHQNPKNDQTCNYTLFVLVQKILDKYTNIFHNAGIGLLTPGSQLNHTSCDINNIVVGNNGGCVYFNKKVWNQIIVRAEEHPLMICWLSSPSVLCEQIRPFTSNLLAEFIGCLEQETLRFFHNDEVRDLTTIYYSRLYSSVFMNFSDTIMFWKLYSTDIYEVLVDSKSDKFKKNFFLHNFYHPSIDNFIFPYNTRGVFKDFRFFKKYCCVAEYYLNYQSTEKFLSFDSTYMKFEERCSLVYMGESFKGDLFIKNTTIYFLELINSPIYETDLFLHLNIKINIQDIRMIYYTPTLDACWSVEIFNKNGSSYLFNILNKNYLDFIVNLINTASSPILIFSHIMSISQILKSQMEWLDKTIDNFTYVLNLNTFYNHSFHSLSYPMLLPDLCCKNDENVFELPQIYFDLFKNYQPFLKFHDISNPSQLEHSSSAQDPIFSIIKLYEFIFSKETTKLIPAFVDKVFGKMSKKEMEKNISNNSVDVSLTELSFNSEKYPFNQTNDYKITVIHEQPFCILNIMAISVGMPFDAENNLPYYYIILVTDTHLYRYTLTQKRWWQQLSGFLSFTLDPSNYLLTLISKVSIIFPISKCSTDSKHLSTNFCILKQNTSLIVVLAGFGDTHLLVYDTHSLVAILEYHLDVITCVDIDTSGKVIVSGSKDGICCEWNIIEDYKKTSSASQISTKLKPNQLLLGHSDSIIDIKYIDENQSVFSYDTQNLLFIHCLKSGLLVKTLSFNQLICLSVDISVFQYLSHAFITCITSFEVHLVGMIIRRLLRYRQFLSMGRSVGKKILTNTFHLFIQLTIL